MRIRTDPAQVPQATAGSLREWLFREARVLGGEVHRDADVRWSLCDRPGSSSVVFDYAFAERRAARRVDEILATYRARHVPATFWLDERAREARVPQLLKSRGLSPSYRVPGFAFDLRRPIPRLTAPPPPRGLTIGECDDFSIFDRFEHPFYGRITTDLRRAEIETARRTAELRPKRVWHLVATLRREPVGWASVSLAEGVAGIFDVGVTQRFRRRGIGTAVTRAAMQLSRKLGQRYVVLQASKAGAPVYRRLGFEEVCLLTTWYYSKTRQAAGGAPRMARRRRRR
jgi:ribosomal protein S18 acetylase RimI-like enzyme